MSTDNAVYTVVQIAENGKKLSELKFQDKISIEINEFESVELPYRYNLVNNKPFMGRKIKDYLAKKSGF
jgi:ribosome biogenesis SPOUT family RNA methylase Rps3